MVRLRHLAGPLAGRETEVRHFPFRIGRGTGDDLRLEAAGLWETHCVIETTPDHRLQLRGRDGASTRVNGTTVSAVLLRNGDILEAGELRLQLWLGPVRQTNLRSREALTWLGIALITAFQAVVAWGLTR